MTHTRRLAPMPQAFGRSFRAQGAIMSLKQTRSYDARRDVVASTTAALDMMQRLNKMFDGDWLLTVAAYNSGEGRVMKAVKAEPFAWQTHRFLVAVSAA